LWFISSGSEWIGIDEDSLIQVSKDLIIKPLKNDHVRKEGIKSLSYQLIRTKRKLKPAYTTLPTTELLQLKQTMGEEAMTEEVKQILVSYSGDTPVSHDGRWEGSEVLIHEATFLHKHEAENANPRANKHSSLEEVMEMVAQTQVGKLVLGHFSSRYSETEITQAISHYATQFAVKVPIYAVLPSVCVKNILSFPHFV
jgi:ribonuclease Z